MLYMSASHAYLVSFDHLYLSLTPPLPTLGLVLILTSFICRLEHNTAGGLGGALYYDSCSKLDRTYFVQGVEPLSGSRAILLRHNRARAGGAVYV